MDAVRSVSRQTMLSIPLWGLASVSEFQSLNKTAAIELALKRKGHI